MTNEQRRTDHYMDCSRSNQLRFMGAKKDASIAQYVRRRILSTVETGARLDTHNVY